MKYGIRWYVGVGEHDYEVSRFAEYDSVRDLLHNLLVDSAVFFSEDELFEALMGGRDATIYWVTDDCGFELYRPS